MKRLAISDGEPVLSNGYRPGLRSWFEGYVAPFEQVADLSLTSLRDAAATYSGPFPTLRLGWADHPTDIFQTSDPSPELVWVESDGEAVLVGVSFSLYEPANYPESEAELADFVRHLLSSMAEVMKAEVARIQIEAFDPTTSREVELWFAISPQRRTLSEAAHFGDSVREHLSTRGRRTFQTLGGVIEALLWAPSFMIGQPESEWLEAKRQPYDLQKSPQRIELAKDIAALANADGGILIFGFSTSKKDGKDVINRVETVPLKQVSKRRYLQTIRTRVFPMPQGLEVVTLGTGEVGLAYVLVPKQREELKPFFMKDALTKGGVKATSLVIPVRVGAHVEYDSPEGIHSLIVAGRAAFRLSQGPK
jgi:hypothetical protein